MPAEGHQVVRHRLPGRTDFLSASANSQSFSRFSGLGSGILLRNSRISCSRAWTRALVLPFVLVTLTSMGAGRCCATNDSTSLWITQREVVMTMS